MPRSTNPNISPPTPLEAFKNNSEVVQPSTKLDQFRDALFRLDQDFSRYTNINEIKKQIASPRNAFLQVGREADRHLQLLTEIIEVLKSDVVIDDTFQVILVQLCSQRRVFKAVSMYDIASEDCKKTTTQQPGIVKSYLQMMTDGINRTCSNFQNPLVLRESTWNLTDFPKILDKELQSYFTFLEQLVDYFLNLFDVQSDNGDAVDVQSESAFPSDIESLIETCINAPPISQQAASANMWQRLIRKEFRAEAKELERMVQLLLEKGESLLRYAYDLVGKSELSESETSFLQRYAQLLIRAVEQDFLTSAQLLGVRYRFDDIIAASRVIEAVYPDLDVAALFIDSINSQYLQTRESTIREFLDSCNLSGENNIDQEGIINNCIESLRAVQKVFPPHGMTIVGTELQNCLQIGLPVRSVEIQVRSDGKYILVVDMQNGSQAYLSIIIDPTKHSVDWNLFGHFKNSDLKHKQLLVLVLQEVVARVAERIQASKEKLNSLHPVFRKKEAPQSWSKTSSIFHVGTEVLDAVHSAELPAAAQIVNLDSFDFGAIPDKIKKHIIERCSSPLVKIEKLWRPVPVGVHARESQYRVRVGGYRVILVRVGSQNGTAHYEIIKSVKREDAYRKF